MKALLTFVEATCTHGVRTVTLAQATTKGGREDTLGHALWGLATAVALTPGKGLRALARERFERARKPWC
jgi:hypothetical protein